MGLFLGIKPRTGVSDTGGSTPLEYTNVVTESSGTATLGFSGTNEFKSQIFTAPSNGNIGRFRFKLWIGAGSPTGTIQGQLWNVVGTQVTTKIKNANGTFNISGLPGTKPGSFNAELTVDAEALVSGTKYAIALDGTGLTVDGSNYVLMSRTSGDAYVNGAYALGSVAAEPYNEDVSSRDLDFEVDYVTGGGGGGDGSSALSVGGFGF